MCPDIHLTRPDLRTLVSWDIFYIGQNYTSTDDSTVSILHNIIYWFYKSSKLLVFSRRIQNVILKYLSEKAIILSACIYLNRISTGLCYFYHHLNIVYLYVITYNMECWVSIQQRIVRVLVNFFNLVEKFLRVKNCKKRVTLKF